MSPSPNARSIKYALRRQQRRLRRQGRRLRRLARDPRGTIRRYASRRGWRVPAVEPVLAPSTPGPVKTSLNSLSPAEALAENGFYIFRGQIPPSEAAWIGATLKYEARIKDGQKSTNLDAVNRFPSTRKVLFDPRVLSAVRQAIGKDARFLQISDLHYHHDTAAWHRDSPYRASDNSTAPDWADTSAPYRVVKAIVYLESENAAMGMMAGSHCTPIEMDFDRVAAHERNQKHLVIRPKDDPNRRLSDAEKKRPIVWSARPGDVLVFDERMYHCGRRFQKGKVSRAGGGRKFTLSFVFGGDDDHSARMYSYFRFARTELKYRALPPPFARTLERHGLVHRNGWKNFFIEHPDDVRGTRLKEEGRADELVAQFQRAAGR